MNENNDFELDFNNVDFNNINSDNNLYFLTHEINRFIGFTERCISQINQNPRDVPQIISQTSDLLNGINQIRIFTDFFQIQLNGYSISEKNLYNIGGKFAYVSKGFTNIIKKKKLSIHKDKYEIQHYFYPFINIMPYILLDNAIKYSPIGSDIDISFTDIRAGGCHFLEISIENMGPHISKEEIAGLFELGKRGGNAKAIGGSGFGIGLNFLKYIIDYHGGTTTIKSDDNIINQSGIPYSLFKCIINIPVDE